MFSITSFFYRFILQIVLPQSSKVKKKCSPKLANHIWTTDVLEKIQLTKFIYDREHIEQVTNKLDKENIHKLIGKNRAVSRKLRFVTKELPG